MAMLTSGAHVQSIGASFAVHYYTTLVKTPEALAALYVPSAHVVHCYKKANGTAELSSLLTSLTAEGLTGVKLEEVTSTPTTSGTIKVVAKGQFVSNASTQPFTQEVELREMEKNTYGVTSDKLSYAAAEQTVQSGEKPVLKAVAELKENPAAGATEETPTEEPGASVKSADARESTSPATAADAAAGPAEVAAAQAPAVNKKPASFAEALRLEKAGGGAAFSNVAVRVTDKKSVTKDKDMKTTSSGAKADKKKEKATSPSGAAATPKLAKALRSAPDSLIYYDIILKELPESTTEEKVRAVVTPVADVRLVNLVKSEKRRRRKESAAETITFAFVQLERPADAPVTHVKDVVAKLTERNKEIRIEEVREKKPTSAVSRKPREGAGSSSKKEIKA
ncbi:hypothetical protein LSCM4_07032 [Leishmania orientalis]|uniref:NTF2 domain-containing protein n=1 Tax=Leishmania orientalis TaxID=2249476 RepID=A0A836GU17_9TRYP|nr:hypothetical protein LSCM4_07032 [Leishmania orientalis]